MKGRLTIIVIILVVGVSGGIFITKDSTKKNIEPATIPTDNVIATAHVENEIPTVTSTSENDVIRKYESKEIVDVAKAELSDSVSTVIDSFMDADGHSYDIFNHSDDAANAVVIRLNKEFTELKYSVYNKAIMLGSGSQGISVISESTKDGKAIGDPLRSTVVTEDEIYPKNIEVDVTGLDYVVIVDAHGNLKEYNFNAIAK